MTHVAFHTGVADPIAYGCRLLRKAYRAGARVTVLGPATLLGRLDQALWTFDSHEFVPHVRVQAGPALRAGADRTPIWLCTAMVDDAPRQTAVNLGLENLKDLEGFERIIEIVSLRPEDQEAGRRRWRAYKAAGHDLVHHTPSVDEMPGG
jgi:DNA polymerase-3 subunit chi